MFNLPLSKWHCSISQNIRILQCNSHNVACLNFFLLVDMLIIFGRTFNGEHIILKVWKSKANKGNGNDLNHDLSSDFVGDDDYYKWN